MNALDLLYAPLALLTAPMWAGKKREGWSERFGKIAPLPGKTAGKRRILLHGVSVGEVSALRPLVPLLQEHDVVVSATTDTGIARARDLFGASCRVVRYPVDFSRCVGRFLDAVAPDVVALCELEVWPNFVAACSARGIPVCVINGRLSERSFRGYSRARFFMKRPFSRLALAAVQDEDYAARFRHMGVPADRVVVTGSMKWDVAVVGSHVPGASELARDLGIDTTRPLIVAGSTGPTDDGGEEALLHAACPPGAQLLCAPRKPERFAEAAAAMPGCARRSERPPGSGADGPPPPSPSGRYLLDSIGELRKAYSLATVAVVGRSFGNLYGSDPIEPVGVGVPTLIGPSYGDFSGMVRALKAAGGLEVVAGQELPRVLGELLAEPAKRAAMAAAGLACIEQERGAAARHAALLGGLAAGSRPEGALSGGVA